ncbi:MAG TPA: thioredoxin family protein [Candidatus Acidoferrales bacterium]|nr:thioredoxin family protein [Candidatus Acidoferrales bacterium]
MRMGRGIGVGIVLLTLFAAASAASAQSAFAPLDLWKAAVQNRDTTALTQLYSITPPARTKSPQGVTDEVGEEPHFWSALAASGLSDFQPKILEVEHIEPGVVALVLRIEFNLRTDSGVQPFVIGASQVWAEEGGDWRIIQTQRGDLAERPARRLPEPAKPDTDLYPPPQEAPSEIKAALARAEKDHKRVLLVFGGNWCYDCHVLNATFHAKEIAPLVNANFHVVHVNIGDDYDKNLDIAAKYQVPLKRGVPALVVLDPDGSLLYTQREGEFEDSARLSPADVTEFLKKWAPPRHE